MSRARPWRGRRLGAGARAAAAALALLCGGAGAAPAAPDSPGVWRLVLRSAQHSDATRLSLGGDLQGSDVAPRRGRNLAYLDDELRLEREQGSWTWGLVARSRASVVANEDSLQLFRQADGGGAVDGSRRWQVDARLRGFSGSGASLGRTHGLGAGWSAGWQAQALVLQRWRERRLSGSAGATGDSYDFAIVSTQRDDRLRLPFQNPFPGRGAAVLGRLDLAWQGERWQAEASVHDLGWLRWRGLPRQDAVLDTRTAAVDADGFVIYQPLVQGQNAQPTARSAAPAWATLRAGWRLDDSTTAEAGAELLPHFGPLPWLGLRLPLGTAQLVLRWRLHERRLTLQWEWQGLSLTAGADRLDSQARSRELGLAWQLPL